MAGQFYRSMRSLQTDGPIRPVTGLIIAFIILSAWGTWAVRARIARYEVTDSARLEIDQAGYPVQARVAGRIVASRLVLGQAVQAGDILVELESEAERLRLQEETTRRNALSPQLAVLRAQIGVQDEGRDDERRVLSFSVQEAKERVREADATAHAAEQNAERSAQLLKERLASVSDDQRAQADAQSKRASAENLRIAAGRLEPELQVRESDRAGRSQKILADVARLEADAATSGSTIKRLEYELEQRRLRAPMSGRLGECAILRPGTWITEGERLGVILPSGNLRMIAEFPPPNALGRVRPGQGAVIRLQGFPWAQYGTVAAKVSRVADEVRDGKIRVELAVNLDPHSRIPFQHGMPGSVEIEVERVSPATLLMRAAGGLMAGQ
jgi:multidrug resistance efflux pump